MQNMIAEKTAKPMIIVMDNLNAVKPGDSAMIFAGRGLVPDPSDHAAPLPAARGGANGPGRGPGAPGGAPAGQAGRGGPGRGGRGKARPLGVYGKKLAGPNPVI